MLSCSGWSQSQGTIPTPFYLLNCGSPLNGLYDEDFDRFVYWKLKEQRNREESDELLLSSCLSQTSIFC